MASSIKKAAESAMKVAREIKMVQKPKTADLPGLVEHSRFNRKPNLYALASSLPEYGVGMKFSKKNWKFSDCYWNITRIRLIGPFQGQAWGVLHWNGKPQGGETVIHGAQKRGDWVYHGSEDMSSYGLVQRIKNSSSSSSSSQ
eukprot:GILI01008896.1.p1 GENE.GILI01008896.1~~GILI01008896.1.p1  ORF type:complete len:143 (-),score=20.01 GILI01008896.1:104-532(-)